MLAIAVLCLMADPTDCTTVRFPLRDVGTENGCLAVAQRQIAENTFPGGLWDQYRISSWGCTRRGTHAAVAQ